MKNLRGLLHLSQEMVFRNHFYPAIYGNALGLILGPVVAARAMASADGDTTLEELVEQALEDVLASGLPSATAVRMALERLALPPQDVIDAPPQHGNETDRAGPTAGLPAQQPGHQVFRRPPGRPRKDGQPPGSQSPPGPLRRQDNDRRPETGP